MAKTSKAIIKPEKKGKGEASEGGKKPARKVMVDFSDHPDLYRMLKECAEKETRPMGHQVLHELRKAVESEITY